VNKDGLLQSLANPEAPTKSERVAGAWRLHRHFALLSTLNPATTAYRSSGMTTSSTSRQRCADAELAYLGDVETKLLLVRGIHLMVLSFIPSECSIGLLPIPGQDLRRT
jgi:hypothetical protein